MSEIIDAPWTGVQGYRLNRSVAHASNPARGFEHDQVIDMAEPRWVLEVSLDRIPMELLGRIEAFLSRLSAGARFRCPPPLRRRPLAWHTGTTRPWLANPAVEASVHAINRATSTVEIGGLAVGATISPGDFAGWVATSETGPRLHQCADLAPVVAGSNGRAIVRVWPRPAPAVQGTVVRLDNPCATFYAPPDQLDQALSIGPGPQPGSLRLTAFSVAG